MSMLRRPGVTPFLLSEGGLYAAFLWLDVTAGSAALSTRLKYASILLCALFALLWRLLGRGDGLTAAALLLTAGADAFLLVWNAHYAAGLALFCGVQLCYFLRLYPARERRSLWPARLGLFLLALAALAILNLLTGLNVLAVFYFSNFVCNLLLAAGGRGSRLRLFAWGLGLFLCCDICVAGFQFSAALPEAVRGFVRVGMWLFYLPGQVLIALSGLPDSVFRGDRS